MIVVCQNCSTPFKTKPARINIGRGKYCSKICANIGRSKPPLCIPCRYCGNTFVAQKRKRFPFGWGVFCSQTCAIRSRCLRPEIERFWKFVHETDGCWIWTGTLSSGYGMFSNAEQRMVKAHRFSYELKYGPIPNGLFACHKCDNRRCVNPDHLFLGTPADNAHDRDQKLRDRFHTKPELIQRGMDCGTAKLTNESIRAIRSEYAAGDITQQELGHRYGVSRSAIGLIVNFDRWTHI